MSNEDHIIPKEAEDENYEGDEINPSLFLFAKYITIYLQPVICTAGLLGNFISFCVFLSKGMRKISSNLYLAGNFLSVWLIVCITVENYIVTFHLSKAVIYCTVFRAKLVIGLLITYSVILYCGQFWTTSAIEVSENYTMCTEVNKYAQLNRIYSFWDTITTMVLPITITSVLIVAILSKNLCVSKTIDGRDSSIYRRLSKKQKCLVRITRVLLAISLTFVILSGPTHANKLRHLILTELNGAQRPYTLSDRILQQIFQIIYYLSSCLNIVYYLTWSHNFRKEIRRLLCLKPENSNREIRGIEMRSKTKSNNEPKQMENDAGNGHQTIVDKSTNPKSQITML
ncbi:hypothetical protein MAR_013191 [Mya arenaria]|uniref:G-protein coupled receptors family 1 profile domain-containing protein n=1 Tax=Mya arenaria TaxID=6604 RepID=A0ABY7FZ78_MYAAR|nr:hypothetical protein MAR_013191 [Mya arenaria]